MTEPRTPGDEGADPAQEPVTDDRPAAPIDVASEVTAAPDEVAAVSPPAAAPDSATEAWPSLTPSGTTSSAASWGAPTRLSTEPEPDSLQPTGSPYEPADSLPEAKLAGVDAAEGPAAPGSRSRIGLRWVLAVVGIVVVIAASALIVMLAGTRPVTSIALGYMPASAATYTEIRMDLPGDQRQKLAAFLANFPGFKDQSQVEPKLDDVLDRIVRAATGGTQTWTADIAPWFGGQIGVSSSVPDMAALGATSPGVMPDLNATLSGYLVVLTITDQAKAEAWLTTSSTKVQLTKGSYNGADLFTATPDPQTGVVFAVAATEKVLIGGTEAAVKAAVDTKGSGALAQDADVKAAFATVSGDYVIFGVSKLRPSIEAVLKAMAVARPGVLEGTQIDETVVGLVPAWQASTYRFESDAIAMSLVSPPYPIGFDATNHASTLAGHTPPSVLLYAESHDVGPALTALIGKFRALPELKAGFASFDQTISLLGGWDAVVGWWGDTAFAIAPDANGVIGAGLLIHPRDRAAADHLFTTLRGFLALAGSSGVNVRDEDHNGTKIVTLDFSALPGMQSGTLPPGYKAELAYAVTDDVVVLGYGRDFVASVLDATPASSLASSDRFKSLLGRVSAENLGLSFVDLNGIRTLVEPIVKATGIEAWASYEKDIKPYLEHVDAIITSVRKDGSVDRSEAAVTVH